ncbi:MAG: NYN domain-containing protein [Candidatus Peregrinibacteria bacterium]|nr:NYN domain-containing protein [Candidatus Peregrinibacteria bacterium]MDZ4245387.1 NYN domain-containing protein [Candidatus Gracilibacteria bacterium]
MKNNVKNYAFIDGQNLHLGTTETGWSIDYKRFRIYLRDKHNVDEAYYFLGYVSEEQQELYNNLQRAGFIVSFREHKEAFVGKKKGNVDTDIVFEMMKALIDEDFNKIILVSGDGDYKKTVDYLIKKGKFEKILFPNQKKASSLYKNLGNKFFMDLSQNGLQEKLEYKKRKG